MIVAIRGSGLIKIQSRGLLSRTHSKGLLQFLPRSQQQCGAYQEAVADRSLGSSAEQAQAQPTQKKQREPPTLIAKKQELDLKDEAWQNAALLIDKNQGWSSFDVCGKLRGMLKVKKKIGHAGTLDPNATGLLIVCVNKGTKSIDTFVGQEKEYIGFSARGQSPSKMMPNKLACMIHLAPQFAEKGEAHLKTQGWTLVNTYKAKTASIPHDLHVKSRMARTVDVFSGAMRLGEATLSYDADLEVSERQPWEHISDDDLQNVARQFTGNLMQVPPMYSAVKVKGERLYHAARRGEVVERNARPVKVLALELRRSKASSQDVEFRVVCSKGTYIRSLVHDMGKRLGSVAHMIELRRTKIGAHHVDDAWTIEELQSAVNASHGADDLL